MKKCSGCQEEKLISEFGKNSKRKDGLQSYCNPCRRAYDRNRYLTTDRPQVAQANRMVARQRNRAYLEDVLRASSCVDCGNNDIRVLEFDHREGSDKVGDISMMVQAGYGLTAIQAEIDKCEIRCANCHRIVTAQRGDWWRNSLWENSNPSGLDPEELGA